MQLMSLSARHLQLVCMWTWFLCARCDVVAGSADHSLKSALSDRHACVLFGLACEIACSCPHMTTTVLLRPILYMFLQTHSALGLYAEPDQLVAQSSCEEQQQI